MFAGNPWVVEHCQATAFRNNVIASLLMAYNNFPSNPQNIKNFSLLQVDNIDISHMSHIGS